MLNRYFEATPENLDFMYANAVLRNLYFAIISIESILFRPEFDIGLYHDEHTYYFFHLQSLLTACGNISNIFYHHGGFVGGKMAVERSRRLRDTLGIHRSDYPLVFQKEARNTNEHFDERYEEYKGRLGDYNLLRENTEGKMRRVILDNPHLRTYDVDNARYITYDRHGRQIVFDLHQMYIELSNMRDLILRHPLIDSGWVDT